VGTLGGEGGEDRDDGARPAGLVRLATRVGEVATHHAVFHKRPSGALVFSAGTRQWSRGLDSSVDMQQATVNLLADMGAQPATLQDGLLPASASTDVVAPVSDVTSPALGAMVSRLAPVLVEGTAGDGAPGQVGGVEVSVDGGLTWHRAEGRESWSYLWTPPADGTYVVLSRAVDDSGNLEIPGAGSRSAWVAPPPGSRRGRRAPATSSPRRPARSPTTCRRTSTSARSTSGRSRSPRRAAARCGSRAWRARTSSTRSRRPTGRARCGRAGPPRP
jgi:hypothetical protein